MPDISEINGNSVANVGEVDALSSISEIDALAFSSSSFSGLFDEYPGAAAGYSVRRLNALYTGACMRVRRSSDNTEQNIGFDGNGELDTAALISFVGSGNNGFVRTWFDQSQSGGTGVGKDLEQTAAARQPLIYNGTSIVTENGKPAIDFDGVDDGLNNSTNVTSSNVANTVITVSKVPVQGSIMQTFSFYRVQRHIQHTGFYSDKSISTNRVQNRYAQYGSIDLANQALQFSWWDGTSSGGSFDDIFLDKDGVSQTSTNGSGVYAVTPSGSNCIGFRSDRNNQFVNGVYQEVIVYMSDQNAAGNKTGIENNVNGYFGVYS